MDEVRVIAAPITTPPHSMRPIGCRISLSSKNSPPARRGQTSSCAKWSALDVAGRLDVEPLGEVVIELFDRLPGGGLVRCLQLIGIAAGFGQLRVQGGLRGVRKYSGGCDLHLVLQ